MLATDPDADRVGIAMKCPDGSYELVSGNEMGALLLDYICAGRIEKGTMPERPVAVKSIVSTPLADAIAAHYGVEMSNVLTGFKWIGDQIDRLPFVESIKKGAEASRLAVAFGLGTAKVALDALGQGRTLLLGDDGDGTPVDATETGDNGLVIGKLAVSVQFEE